MGVIARAWPLFASACVAFACGDPATEVVRSPQEQDLLPCAVAQVIEAHCAACHGAVQQRGAPLALVRASDAHAMHKGETVGARMLARVTDDAQPMPPPPYPRLPAAAIASLRAWIDRGAPADQNGCPVREPESVADGGAAGHAGTGIATLGPGSDWPMFGGDLENSA